MKTKYPSKIFLDVAKDYELDIYSDNEDYYLIVKKFKKVIEPFITLKGNCLIDDGYYILEIIPKNEKYTIRIFVNNKKEILEYYFDITYKNGLDEETNILYYVDLYLDITVKNNKIEILDEDELQEALDNKEITKEQFDLANKTKDELIKTIKNKTNKFMNLDINKYLK